MLFVRDIERAAQERYASRRVSAFHQELAFQAKACADKSRQRIPRCMRDQPLDQFLRPLLITAPNEDGWRVNQRNTRHKPIIGGFVYGLLRDRQSLIGKAADPARS